MTTIQDQLTQNAVFVTTLVLGGCYVIPLVTILTVEVSKWFGRRLRTVHIRVGGVVWSRMPSKT
jgi:hypothetical protein